MRLHAAFVFVLFALTLPGPLLAAATIYVDDDNTAGPWNGSQAYPYQYIQDGIDAANPGDTVIVRDGTYTGALNKDLDFGGKALTLRSQNGAASTIIDCEGAGRGFYFYSGEGEDSVVDGLTVTNGSIPAYYGGGILCDDSSSPTIANCAITGNAADGCGGIACNHHSCPRITNCTITGNTSSTDAGGIRCYWYSDAQITNCTITGNMADDDGGGIYCYYANPTITNCTIRGNWLTNDDGGGIFCLRSSPTITSCEITDNDTGSSGDGGGIYCEDGSSPTITNCTIANNWAFFYAGIFCYLNSSPTITNCIVWGNSYPDIYTSDGSVPVVTWSDVDDGTGEDWFGTGCIEQDPQFVNAGATDYRLGPGSPCIDSGYGDYAAKVPMTDIAGRARVDDPDVANTGAGTPDYVDMGAREAQAAWDVVWRNSVSGMVYMWFMDGLTITSQGVAGTLPIAWHWQIKGVGN